MTDLPPFDGPHFDDLYRTDPDPWRVDSAWYERRKLAAVMAALPRERYRRGLELGCSIGATTQALADRCDDLLAVDASAEAVRRASERLAGHAHVSVRQAHLPDQMPTGERDLVVMGEVGYFLRSQPLDVLLRKLPVVLADGGDLLAVHWRHDADRLPVGGDEVHRRLDRLGLLRLVSHVEDDFRLDVWRA